MSNYQKGRQLEYEIMKELEQQGYVCIRSAGSHGLVDVVAIPRERKNHIVLIQAKRVKKLYKYLVAQWRKEASVTEHPVLVWVEETSTGKTHKFIVNNFSLDTYHTM